MYRVVQSYVCDALYPYISFAPRGRSWRTGVSRTAYRVRCAARSRLHRLRAPDDDAAQPSSTRVPTRLRYSGKNNINRRLCRGTIRVKGFRVPLSTGWDVRRAGQICGRSDTTRFQQARPDRKVRRQLMTRSVAAYEAGRRAAAQAPDGRRRCNGRQALQGRRGHAERG